MRLTESLFSRRRFLDALIGVTGSALVSYLLYPIAKFLWGHTEVVPDHVLLKDFPDPSRGEAVYFKYGARPAMVFKTETGELRAFTAVCTHLNCTLQYDAQRRRIWCACHQGVFDLDGKNVAGPPPRPLTRYFVQRQGSDLLVRLNPQRDT